MTESQSPYLTHREAQFVKFYQAGRSSRWTAAFFAAQIVGTYDGRTKELAKGLCVSEDTIEALARAAITYRSLKIGARNMGLEPGGTLDIFRAVTELRSKLSVSHWAAAGRLVVSRDLEALEIFSILQWAAENGASVRAMLAQVGESEHPEPRIASLVRSLIVKMQDLAVRTDAPALLHKWAATQSEFLQKAAEKYKVL